MREKLISLREDRKLTQEQVAEMVGISRSFYGHIELGKRNPSFGLAKKIASVFSCSPEDIFFDLDCFRLKPNLCPTGTEGR